MTNMLCSSVDKVLLAKVRDQTCSQICHFTESTGTYESRNGLGSAQHSYCLVNHTHSLEQEFLATDC